jgi:dipeptidyl aminopeptidase/acylaminoacyl peptidase
VNRKSASIAVVMLALGLAPATQAEVAETAGKPIPAEAFYRHDEIEGAALSPSGRWLAIKTGLGGARFGLVAVDLDKGGAPQNTARFGNADVWNFHWVNDDRLVFSVADRESSGGLQRVGGGLFSVRPDGSELKLLIKYRWGNLSALATTVREPLNPNHFLLKVPAGGGDHVVIGEAKFDSRNALSAVNPLRMNVLTGHVESLAVGAPADVRRWLFDPKGNPRVAEATRKGRSIVYWQAPGGREWTQLADSDWLEPAFTPEFVDAADRLFVSTADGQGDTEQLHAFDLAAKKPAPDPFVKTPGFDYSGALLVDPATGRTLGLRIWTDAATTVWFDEAMKAAQKAVDAKLQGRINFLSCARCAQADKVILVRSYSDQDPGHYWIYRPEGERWQDIGPERSGIDARRMARVDLHRIRTRDGLEMPVWVTTPAGPKPAMPRPAVVLVHGGPWVRGVHWNWNADAQFLASRGYVVVEPEFRGSTGYGMKHFRAGFKQWGKAMQDDVADAALWAVDKSGVDPKRICIAGASYGGYATLMGLARHPELYRCGVAWVAVSDPRLMYELDGVSDVGDMVKQYGLPTLIGDPVKDRDALTAVAPVEQAARIKAPLMLAYGAKDERVPLEHGDRMRAALRAAGNDPEWVLYPDEGHGWFLVADRVDFAERMERFLAKHLKP